MLVILCTALIFSKPIILIKLESFNTIQIFHYDHVPELQHLMDLKKELEIKEKEKDTRINYNIFNPKCLFYFALNKFYHERSIYCKRC